MRLQGRVAFARSDTRAEQLAPFAKGGLDGLLWVFDQDDRSQHWSDFLVRAREQLLTYVTEFHQAAGATRITATSDAVNHPMAAAFARNGYRTIETRIDIEAAPG